ncbi:MAG: M48 family metallopeptidase [Bifidobacteriaceae bacterium]|jgi:predicted metal-dependent hydrolase|nr:M48 family metallopeptidase [Bifidobacteriaceae bacterium]
MNGSVGRSEGKAAQRDMAQVRVERSARRSKTVSAYRKDGVLVVAIPADFTADQEREWVAKMSARLLAKEARSRLSDDALAARARRLSEQYLGGRARPASVVWSADQQKRWGSATKDRGTIRLSVRLSEVPGWVLDYVLLHELIHLIAPHGHGPQFRALLARFPHADMAEGFLRGLAWADVPAHRREQDDAVPSPPQDEAPCPLTLF